MLSTFHLFPKLPKEMRLQIYESTFEARILQLGVDAGVPFPPGIGLLGYSNGPTKQLHTHLPSLFAVCIESRDMCKSVFVACGPTFIHPRLDTLYISHYAIMRMVYTESAKACGSSAYSLAAFDRVAIEFGVESLPEDVAGWKEKPKTWRVRRGIRELCAPKVSPATDYAEFFRCFGAPREILLVNAGKLRWYGGSSKFGSWRSIELVATEINNTDQVNLVDFLKAQLPSSLTGARTELTVVDARKDHLVCLTCPYSWTTWRDKMEIYSYS
ncbi:hypothetical protein GLAREA_07604 [Glarea lozoyensis ATCC 20868]|uniref:2EXR domain-containing protein n=1 Tax=Glarea lozoyensis (strain ATCC 20868 / MF5171) TaxID=1116229 RepID=S3DK85_GLAL2|nr:uncharacterized protein GLAREA_07604 [Glarea lozoyensis ATCC 20868]EPE32471.1 hypothetical protein GLAREA_07604 [Glarea lozoyensis ATCC 20868]